LSQNRKQTRRRNQIALLNKFDRIKSACWKKIRICSEISLRKLKRKMQSCVSVPSYKIEQKEIVWYFVRAKRQTSGEERQDNFVVVSKRYSHFVALFEKLKERFMLENVPQIPPKKNKVLFNHTKKDFVERRRVLLETFMKKLFENPVFAESREMEEFFQTDFIESKAIRTIFSEENEASSKTAKFFFEEHFVSDEISEVSIPAVQHMEDHTLFRILCRNGDLRSRSDHNEWISLKRFLDFCDLDDELRNHFSKSNPGILDAFPPLPLKASKMITDHREPKFVEERRLILENYLKKMIHIRLVVTHNLFLRFLNAGI
jgi:hypothetical protein